MSAVRTQLLTAIGLGVAAISSLPVLVPRAAADTIGGAADLNLRESCGATADGVADDSGALKLCLTRLQAAMDSGRPAVLRIPAGIYRITGANGTMPTLTGRGGALVGDGPHQSYFVLDGSYTGDLFSWSEAWIANNFGPPSFSVAKDATGPTVTGLQVTGSTDSPAEQNAFAFYDRNDNVLMRDVEIAYLNGQCLSIGRTRSMAVAYMRESAFYNFKCWNAGTPKHAAIEIGSTSSQGSDATNELDFYKVAVFGANGTGVAIRNPNRFSATRRLRFFGLRIEHTGADGLTVGTTADRGQVAEIEVYDLTVVQAKGAALRFTGAAEAPQPYAISILGGSLGPGNDSGIAIDKGRLLEIDLANVDAPVLLGPGSGTDITIRGNGAEHYWTFKGESPQGGLAQPLNLRTTFGLYGFPKAGDRVGATALLGSTSDDKPARLTMDGGPPDASNCFNPGHGSIANLRIQLVARDMTNPGRWYAWTLPMGVLSVAKGAESATWVSDEPVVLFGNGVAGAHVMVNSDKLQGCLFLTFAPPPGNKAQWEVTAHVDFARTR